MNIVESELDLVLDLAILRPSWRLRLFYTNHLPPPALRIRLTILSERREPKGNRWSGLMLRVIGGGRSLGNTTEWVHLFCGQRLTKRQETVVRWPWVYSQAQRSRRCHERLRCCLGKPA